MPGKMVECPSCTKLMRSDNLKRHKNCCKMVRNGDGIQKSWIVLTNMWMVM